MSQKHVIVKPRLKKTTLNPEDLNSFRPISNLSFLSRLIERVVAIWFIEHVEANKFLPKFQSAYHANHSNETAVTAVHNDIIHSVDRKDHLSVLILLDLSTAFNTVDHGILLAVLERRFRISGIAFQWYCPYLTEHAQTFQVGMVLSLTYNIDCSVPQGSVHDMLKFITYTEDLPAVIKKCNIDHHLYADDGQLSDHPSIATVPASIHNMEVCVHEVHN